MANYKIYMRSFAPWRQFGQMVQPSQFCVPVPAIPPSPYPYPSVACINFAGAYHGDGRRFSLDTGGSVTARVNAVLEVNLDKATKGSSKVWCDPSAGPWMFAGAESSGVGSPTSELTVSRDGAAVKVVIDYGAANPLASPVAPDINARGEFSLTPGSDTLSIVSTITGDQFPACESFIEDPSGKKLFLGGFAPDSKEQIMRLYGFLNTKDPLGRAYTWVTGKDTWFESEIVVSVDGKGNFLNLQGGGSGSNSTGPACEGVTLRPDQWNARVMSSIPMPFDAG
jgi:hypothetical protein